MPGCQRQDRWLDLVQAGAVVVLLVGLALLVVVWLTEGVGKAGTWASVLGTSLAIIGGIVTLITARRRRRVVAAAPAMPEQLVQAAPVLAGIVSEQWRREAEARALGDPEPMPVRWRLSDDPVMRDHPQVIAPGGLAFSGRSDRVVPLIGEFRRLERRRLVITGGAGSGKTTLAVQLLLELLTHPQPGEPVPVLFSLVGWDPQSHPRVQDWLTARLELDYPALRSFGANTAGALVERGMILPVLDGLDEVPDHYRAEIITRLNASLAADTGLILTSRSTEFSATVTAADVLTAAAVIAPEPLSAAEAAAYLRTAVPPSLSASWSPVLAALETGAAADLARIVSRPLGLWLVRSVHIDGRLDPTPLIDGTHPTADALQAHLFDELIPAAICSRPRAAADPLRPDRSYRPEDVRRWLGYLARQMTDAGTRDWQWWHLARHTLPATRLRLVIGLVAGLVAGLGYRRGTDIMLGGNPDYLADARLRAKGLDPVETPDDYEAAWDRALEEARSEVKAEAEEVKEAGGLYVLGTERHESRRIDNQLRGRSGRQGDPGESRFYLSLRDELMLRFNGPFVERVMTSLKMEDDVPIEAKMVSKAILSAQTQVEQQNFEIRKNVLKYDEVMDLQRKVIYAERRRVLEGEDLREQVHHMLTDVVTAYVNGATANGYAEDWDLDGLWKALKTLYPVGVRYEDIAEEAEDLTRDVLLAAVLADAREAYARREAELTEQAGETAMRQLERRVVLSVLDRKWREHLYEMDYLKEGIGLRAMAQRDPLVEYKREGFEMFRALLDALKEESVSFLFNLQVQVVKQQPAAAAPAADRVSAPPAAPSPTAPSAAAPSPAAPSAVAPAQVAPSPVGSAISQLDGVRGAPVAPGVLDAPAARPLTYSGPTETGAAEVRGRSGEREAGNGSATTVTGGQEPSRNAACPCGSGRKYKRCHGAPTEAARF